MHRDVVIVQPFAGVNGLLHDPPVSRTGNKRRFRPVLEGIFGYHRRDVRLSWSNDLDLGCWLLGLCYASPELARAVSRLISSWVPCPECLPGLAARAARGEVKPTPEMCLELGGREVGCPVCTGTGVRDARQLWEELRRAPIPEDVVSAAGVWATLQGRAFSASPVAPVDGIWRMEKGGVMGAVGFKSEEMGGVAVNDIASRFASLSRSAPSIVTRLDAGQVTPERFASTLAAWMVMQSRSFNLKPVTEDGGLWSGHGWKPEVDTYFRKRDGECRQEDSARWTLASSVRASDVPAIVSRLDAAQCVPDVLGSLLAVDAPDGDLPLPATLPWTGKPYRVVLFCDADYEGTTGYGHSCERSSYVAMVKRWLEAGREAGVPVTVGISEACDLSEELADATGQLWHGYEIGSMVRRSSSFWAAGDDGESKQREFVTTSAKAVRLPAVQVGMFAGVR